MVFNIKLVIEWFHHVRKLHERGLFNKSLEFQRDQSPASGTSTSFTPGLSRRQWLRSLTQDLLTDDPVMSIHPSLPKGRAPGCRSSTVSADIKRIRISLKKPSRSLENMSRVERKRGEFDVLSWQHRNYIVLPNAREYVPKSDPLSRNQGKM